MTREQELEYQKRIALAESAFKGLKADLWNLLYTMETSNGQKTWPDREAVVKEIKHRLSEYS